jgi:antitoxin HigA-1
MITSWRHKGLKLFYETGRTTQIQAKHANKLHDILQALDFATAPEQMNFPGLWFHKLKGKLKDFYSVKVSGNWRVIFGFEGKNYFSWLHWLSLGDREMIHKPKHPGRMVKSLCLDALGLSVTEAAKALKVSRPTLSKLVNGRIGISTEMAVRLAIVFNTSEEFWINLQTGYDLWLAQKHRKKLNLKPLAQAVHSAC